MPTKPGFPPEYRTSRNETSILRTLDEADTGLDIVVNWLAEHPRLTAVMIIVTVILAFSLDIPT